MNKAAVALLYFMLCFYGLGASLMEHFATDRAWIYAGPREFPVLHHESGQGVLAAYVIPLIVLTLFTVSMLWYWVSTPGDFPRNGFGSDCCVMALPGSRRLLFRYPWRRQQEKKEHG